MKARGRRAAGIVSIGGLLAVVTAGAAPASSAAPVRTAAVPGAVPFAQSSFSGYSSGHEVGVGALTLGTTTQGAGLVQAFSGASSVSPNGSLASPIIGDNGGVAGTGLLVQPAQPASVKAFGTGIGASSGLAAAANGSANQLKEAGQATQVAPPNRPAVTVSLPSSAVPVPASPLGLPAGLFTASALAGRGAAFYDPTGCPLGQPLGYGYADAADAGLVDFSQLNSQNPLTPIVGGLIPAGGIPGLPGLSLPASGELISTAGAADAAATSDSETFLSANGDGTYGYSTQARQTIAPITVDLFGAGSIQITVSGSQTAQTPAPVTLTARTTGEGSGAAVTLLANDFVGVNLVTGSGATATTTAILPPTSLQALIGAGGRSIDLNPSTLVTQAASLIGSLLPSTPLAPVLTPLGSAVQQLGNAIRGSSGSTPLNVSFGRLDVGTPVHAINGAATTKPQIVGGGEASGAVDILRLHLGLTSSQAGITVPGTLADVADLTVGHLEAKATDAAPITCALPVVKSADPTTVRAGGQFTYTIQIPDPAGLADLSCSLTHVTATDVITDGQGTPTFNVVGVSNGGTVNQTSPTRATVTWNDLTYQLAPVGAPPNPPITLTITLDTPSSSPAGIIQDVVDATGTTSGCTGGVSGIANLGGAGNVTLTGSYALAQPDVTAGLAALTGTAPQGALPHTGGTGGLWQPLGGLAVLGLGGGALALARRSRRQVS